MHVRFPVVDPSTAGVSLPLDLGQIHSLFARTLFKKNDVVFRPCPRARTGRGYPVRLRYIMPLQDTLRFQADVFFSRTDDDVVKQLNPDDTPDLDEPFCHLDVFP